MAKVVRNKNVPTALRAIPQNQVLTPGDIQSAITPSIQTGMGMPASDIDLSEYGNVKNKFLTGFDDVDRLSLDETRAKNQSILGLIGKGIGNAGSTFINETLKIPGYLGGLVADVVSGNVFQGDLSNTVDNFWLRGLNYVKENTADEAFKVYTPPSLEDEGLLGQVLNPYFWAKEGADGVGFLLSFLIPGQALKLAGVGGKVAKTLGKTGRALDFDKIASTVDSGLAITVNTLLEAAAEGSNTYDNLIKQGYSPEEAGKAASQVVAWNLPVLLVSNTILEKYLFSGFGRLSGKSGFGRLTPEVIKGTKELGKQYNFIKPNLLTGVLQEGFFEEGLQTTIEQTHGGSLYDIASKYYDNITGMFSADADSDAIDFGKSVILGGVLGSGMSALGNVRENISSNRLLFGQTASTQNRFDKFIGRKAREAKEGLISVFRNNYATIKQDGKELFNYDDNGNILGFKEGAIEKLQEGAGIHLLTNFYNDLIRKHDGNIASARQELQAQLMDTGADIADIMQISSDLSSGEVLEQVKNREDFNYFMNFLTQPNGYELLRQHIPAIAENIAIRYKNNTGQDLPNIKEVESELLEKAEKFNKIYETVDKSHSPYRLQVDPYKSGKDADRGEKFQKFFNEAKVRKLAALSDVELATTKIEELNSLLEPISGDIELSPIVAKNKKQWEKDKQAYEKIKKEAEEEYIKLDDTKSLQELWETAYNKQTELEAKVEKEIEKRELNTQTYNSLANEGGYSPEEGFVAERKGVYFKVSQRPDGTFLLQNIADATKNNVVERMDFTGMRVINKQEYAELLETRKKQNEAARQLVKQQAITKTLREKLAELSIKQSSTSNAIQELESQIADLENQANQLFQEIADKKLNAFDKGKPVPKLATAQRLLKKIQSTIIALKDSKDKLQQELEMYEMQEELLLNIWNIPDYLKTIRKEFPNVDETLETLRELMAHDKSLIAKYEDQIARLEDVARKLRETITDDDITRMLAYKQMTQAFEDKYSYTDENGVKQTLPLQYQRILKRLEGGSRNVAGLDKFLNALAVSQGRFVGNLKMELYKDLKELQNTVIPSTASGIDDLFYTQNRINELRDKIRAIRETISPLQAKQDLLVHKTLATELMNRYKQIRKATRTDEEIRETAVSPQDKPENQFSLDEVWWDKIGSNLFVTTGISIQYGDNGEDIYTATDGIAHPIVSASEYQRNWFSYMDSNPDLTGKQIMLVTAKYDNSSELESAFAANNPNNQESGKDVYAVLVDKTGKPVLHNGLLLFSSMRTPESMFPAKGKPAINLNALINLYRESIEVTSFTIPNSKSKEILNKIFGTETPSEDAITDKAIAWGREEYTRFIENVRKVGTAYTSIQGLTAGHPVILKDEATGEVLNNVVYREASKGKPSFNPLGLEFDSKGLPVNFDLVQANKDGEIELDGKVKKGFKTGVVYIKKGDLMIPLESDKLNEDEVDLVYNILLKFSKRDTLTGNVSPDDIQAEGFKDYMKAGIDEYQYEVESGKKQLQIFPHKGNRFSLMTILMNWGQFDNPNFDIYISRGNLVLGELEIPMQELDKHEDVIKDFLANKRFHINFSLLNHVEKGYTPFAHPARFENDKIIFEHHRSFVKYVLSRMKTTVLPKETYTKLNLPQFAQKNLVISGDIQVNLATPKVEVAEVTEAPEDMLAGLGFNVDEAEAAYMANVTGKSESSLESMSEEELMKTMENAPVVESFPPKAETNKGLDLDTVLETEVTEVKKEDEISTDKLDDFAEKRLKATDILQDLLTNNIIQKKC